MGFLTAYSRTIYLTRYVNDIQAKLVHMTEEKHNLLDQITNISDASNMGDSDSAAVKELKTLKERLTALDRQLDVKMKEMQTRLQAASKEMESANNMLQQNIQSSFQYGFGGR